MTTEPAHIEYMVTILDNFSSWWLSIPIFLGITFGYWKKDYAAGFFMFLLASATFQFSITLIRILMIIAA